MKFSQLEIIILKLCKELVLTRPGPGPRGHCSGTSPAWVLEKMLRRCEGAVRMRGERCRDAAPGPPRISKSPLRKFLGCRSSDLGFARVIHVRSRRPTVVVVPDKSVIGHVSVPSPESPPYDAGSRRDPSFGRTVPTLSRYQHPIRPGAMAPPGVARADFRAGRLRR